MIEYTVKVYSDRTEWYFNGKLHRVGEPALAFVDGTKLWYRNGQLHREDGPAIEWDTGKKEWWLDDEWLSEEEFNQRINDLKQPTCEGRTVVIDGVTYNLTRTDS
jgi:hypothetical protein